jgi:hypothetical protein
MAEDKPQLPDLHLGNAADAVRHKLSAQAVVLLVVTKDGAIALTGSNANHALANDMLSRGIALNYAQHDAAVLAGAAGEEAQEDAERIERANHGEVTA